MQQYYAHPQNAFWKLVGSHIRRRWPHCPTRAGCRILTSNRIALWDVLAAAERPGSLDSSIVHASALANDFANFYRAHPRIRRVFFNGRKAEELYRRFALPGLASEFADIRYDACRRPAPPTRA